MNPLRAAAAFALICLAAPTAHGQQIDAVRVNGAGISVAEIEARFDETLKEKGLHLLQVRDPNRVKQMKHEALDSLIDEELLWQEARKRGAVADDAMVDAAFAQAAKVAKGEDRLRLRLAQEEVSEADFRERIRRRLSGSGYAERVAAAEAKVSEDDVRAFYDQNQTKFHRPEMLRARHILIKLAPGAYAAERSAARKRIARIRAEAKAGKDFGELARAHSEDATSQWDGQLDPFARGTHAPEFEKAAFALQPGQISGIVATPAGLHVIRLDERIPEITVSLADARERIKAQLVAKRTEEAKRKLSDELRALADIEVRLPY